MLKRSCRLLGSTRIIANRLCNPYRNSSSSTDDVKKSGKRKYQYEFRNDDGTWDISGRTPGSGVRGPTVDEVREHIRENPDVLPQVAKYLWQECKVWKGEIKEYLRHQPIAPPHGTIDMVYTFENEEKLDNFVVTTDDDHGIGESTATLTTTSRETALFSGFLSNKLKADGINKWSGYVNFNSRRPMKSFGRATYHDWYDYTHLVLKVRGDGRVYSCRVASPGSFQDTFIEQYSYPLYTRGGPYWQIYKIPFSKFVYGKAGVVQTVQYRFRRDHVARIGFTLADNIDGPFSLEIEYIGVERNEYHNEITAYEDYYTDAPIIS